MHATGLYKVHERAAPLIADCDDARVAKVFAAPVLGVYELTTHHCVSATLARGEAGAHDTT